MKLVITFIVFAVVFSFLKATEFTDEEVELFLPFLRRSPPPPCPANEMHLLCSGKCSDCTQRNKCVVSKCEQGCDCIPRFFRVTKDGPCEPVAKCPKPECSENEVFRECGPVCETCTNMECHLISCDHKCYCKKGYLRNKEGVCIAKDECPKRSQCMETEEWAESGPIDEFCIHEIEEDVRNKTQDIPGCYCKEGFKRNVLGYCVNATICHFVKCLGLEVYKDCIPKCNTTCRNYGDPDCLEDDNCYSGCFCPSGYVMNDFRFCIKVDECSLGTQQLTTNEDETTGITPLPTWNETDKIAIATNSTTNDSIEIADSIGTDDKTSKIDSTTVTNSTTTVMDSATTVNSVTTDDAAEFVTETDTGVGETASVEAIEQDSTTVRPTSVSSVSDSIAKETSYKKDKTFKDKETKHENIAKEKDAAKYIPLKDDDRFENENI